MSNNPNPADENSQPQQANQVNWNQNSFGFSPFYIWEKIFPGFRKVLSHAFGWDYNNTIWRPQGVDSAGNVRVSNGTQGANAPLQQSVTVTTTPTNFLTYNPSRSGFIIYNDGRDNTIYTSEVFISYPNINENSQVIIPPGYAYIDNGWNGTVSLYITSSALNAIVTIVEF